MKTLLSRRNSIRGGIASMAVMMSSKSKAWMHHGAGVPSGATIVVAFGDQITLPGGNILVPNRVQGPAPTVPNLFIAQHASGNDDSGVIGNINNTSIVTNPTLGPNGLNVPAFTINSGVSFWRLYEQLPQTITIGTTVTLGVDAKLVSGTGSFYLGNPFNDPTFGSDSAIVPTSSWQSFSRTFQISNSTMAFGVGSNSAVGSSSQIAFDNFRLYSGSQDVGANNAQPSAGNCYLTWHGTPSTTSLNFTNGVLTTIADPGNTPIGYGFIEIPTPFSTTAMTIGARVSAQTPNSPTQATLQGWISGNPRLWLENDNDFLFIGNSIAAGNIPGIGLGGNGGNAYLGQDTGLTTWFNSIGTPGSAPFSTIIHTWDGTTAESWVNGSKLLSKTWVTSPPTSGQALSFFFNYLNGFDHPGFYQWRGGLALYPRKLSDNEVVTLTNYLSGL